MNGDTAIVILAAGGSSRLGRPKQLLLYRQKTLVERIVDEALLTALPVVVVTGAAAEEVAAALQNKKVVLLYNTDWQSGMASGIAAGVATVLSFNKQLQKIILAVCDQPFVTAALFLELVTVQRQTGKGIVACRYAGTAGTPVLFTQSYFEELKNLSGKEGAKKLLKIHTNDVATVPFPQGSIDVDTEEDYQNLLDGPAPG